MPVQEEVLDEIRRMSAADLADLVRALSADLAAAPAPTTTPSERTSAVGPEPHSVGLSIASSVDRIELIKAVREATDLGLREARELVDSAPDRAARRGTERDEGPEPAGVPALPKPPLPQDQTGAELALPPGVPQME